MPEPPLLSSTVEDTNADPGGACPHVDRDSLLHVEHLQDEPQALEMQIGPVEEDFFDSQKEDFYYDNYNEDDEEKPEVWKDGEEVHLQVPPELLHAPERRGKKCMHMQCQTCTRSDAEMSASAASLFESPPRSPLAAFEAYFLQRTATATIYIVTPDCTNHTHANHIDALTGYDSGKKLERGRRGLLVGRWELQRRRWGAASSKRKFSKYQRDPARRGRR